ncbi:hypothetical protein BMF94_4535 [Rhodotorula taiwanensis]|uniref:Glucose-methanol-choline oxidoreductase N-terminal domain-containing protein n=1 Tax=Rhodotorula taiwanensis TaxID=741276 RepID=A0A2S5B7H2_9BASI|nr:hypothetical protein BMF94_4535 [Rhodotorula taiwanensis]
MPSPWSLGVAVALAASAASAAELPTNRIARQPVDWRLKERSTVTDATALAGQTFDYVIVGGGTAGLVMASRLSENSSVTVAVIEAGSTGDEVADKILAPAMAYFGGLANPTSPYDWGYQTTNQSELDARQIFWPRGRVLGGSSAVNGLYMIRPSAIEQDSWASLTSDPDNWGWDPVFASLTKSENYTAPNQARQEEVQMVVNASSHGTNGPIHYSYPGFWYDSIKQWMPTLGNLGVGTHDPDGGESWGAFIATSAIDPTTWTRSYSKTGYLDPAAGRSNLVTLTGYQVTKVVFDGTTATGVEFAAGPGAGNATYTVSASKEVILSAGVIGTPQILQVSGVGPSELLTPLGIDVVADLPGVGMHLTDHLSGAITLNTSFPFSGDPMETNTTYAAAQLALWKAGNPDSLYTAPNDAVAYVNLTTLLGSESAAQTFMNELETNKSAAVQAYSSNAQVQAGYNATYSAELDDVYPSAVGQAEILLSNTGTYGGYPGAVTVQIQAAIQHPLSRGTIKITSNSTFDKPEIDPGYLTHPGDIVILREAFKYARKISQTAPFSEYVYNELSPGAAVSTDAEWEAWLRGVVSTEYHPAGSASMLPKEYGGVVDNAMRVYGVSNLRVVDSSMVPLSLSAHMTAPLYGYSERAYEILMKTPAAIGGSTTATIGSGSSTSTSSSASTTSSAGTSASAGANAAKQSATSAVASNASASTFLAYAVSALALMVALA